jgi:membrane protein implicated in regulation of membrane protease activity
MIPLGMLGQIYAVCAGIGSIFMFASFIMGHHGDEGGHEGGHDDGGGGSDFNASDDGGGSDFNASDDGGGSDFNAGDDGGGSDFNAGDDGGGSDFNAGNNGPNHRVAPITGRTAMVHRSATNTIAAGFFGFILTLLSPMTVCIYLAFFGLTGLVLAFNASWMGYFTLIPSIAVSIGVSAAFKAMTQWMIKNTFTSTHQREADLLGQMAEVNVPIHDGRMGEVTYVLNAKRMTASAQPAKPGIDFKKGSKVLIVGSKEHVVLIEPYDPEHDELEQRFIS